MSARVAEIDAESGLHGFDAERQAQVAFARSRRPDQMHDLRTVDELHERSTSDDLKRPRETPRPFAPRTQTFGVSGCRRCLRRVANARKF